MSQDRTHVANAEQAGGGRAKIAEILMVHNESCDSSHVGLPPMASDISMLFGTHYVTLDKCESLESFSATVHSNGVLMELMVNALRT